MPSIPQSLLWISLVVLWLFVLVPMLISKRDAVRRTSDVALATRVLNGGPVPAAQAWWSRRGSSQRPRLEAGGRRGRGRAHRRRPGRDTRTRRQPTTGSAARRPVVMKVAAAEQTEPDYLDVDVVEDSGALPAGASAEVTEPGARGRRPSMRTRPPTTTESEDVARTARTTRPRTNRTTDTNTSRTHRVWSPRRTRGRRGSAGARRTGCSRRRRFDTKTAAAVSARKYAFRKRVLMVMAVILVGSATAAFEVSPTAWWVCGSATVATVLYLAYLRRQTRIEEKVRRRRMQRMARARLGVENAYDREYDVVPSRLRRPGAVVLEIDDEDPIFEHLDYAMPMRTYRLAPGPAARRRPVAPLRFRGRWARGLVAC